MNNMSNTRNLRQLIYVLLFLVFYSNNFYAYSLSNIEIKVTDFIEISKDKIDPDKVIGIRSYQNILYIADNKSIIKILPNYVEPSKSTLHTLINISDNSILDFTISKENLFYINKRGFLYSLPASTLSSGPYDACKVEASNDGLLLLLGGRNTYVFPVNRNASIPVVIDDIQPCYPLDNGFIVSLSMHQITKVWSIDLLEQLGNKLKRFYKFDRKFKPNAFNFIAVNSDHEILVSYEQNNKRYVSLFATNGRMVWRINLPKPICPRDITFSPDNKLVIITKNKNGNLLLQRIHFAIPAG